LPGADRFFVEGIKVENESGDDPYRELARQTLTAKPYGEPPRLTIGQRLAAVIHSALRFPGGRK
jgi:hypothetical protein